MGVSISSASSLIVKSHKKTKRSAQEISVLDNRFHRTVRWNCLVRRRTARATSMRMLE
jgi:hypothetical protein